MQRISVEGKLCLLLRHLQPKVKHRDDDIMHLLAPSLLGICLCIVCLCASSWAWFTAEQQAQIKPLQAATFTVEVIPIDENGVELTDDIGLTKSKSGNTSVFTLNPSAQTAYKFKITALGTASTGYCKIILNGTEGDEIVRYTKQLSVGETLEFTYYPSSDDKAIKITPCWGTLANRDPNQRRELRDGGTVGTPQ